MFRKLFPLMFLFLAACSEVDFSSQVDPATALDCANVECDGDDSGDNGDDEDSPIFRKVDQSISFTHSVSNAADILFVIDNSGSMDPDLNELADKFSNLISSISTLDWRICLTTTDVTNDYMGSDGKLYNFPNGMKYIGKGDPDAQQKFVDAINYYRDQPAGSGTEQGVKAIYRSLERYQGCFRQDASLSTVIISDENEKSNGTNLENKNYPSSLLSLVDSTFGTEKTFVNHSIITRSGDQACKDAQIFEHGDPDSAFFGTNYESLSGLTNGLIGDICAEDYSNQLSFIGDLTVTNTFGGVQLECTPLDENGNPLESIDEIISETTSSSPITIEVDGYNVTVTSDDLTEVTVEISYYCEEKSTDSSD